MVAMRAVQLTSRHGYETTLAGVAVSAATEILTVLGAGNRDPRRFDGPDRFDPLRTDGGPLSSAGAGISASVPRLRGSRAQ
jgi:cytochrome P450